MLASLSNKFAAPGSLPDMQKACEKHGQFMAKHFFGNHWGRCLSCEAERADAARVATELQAKRLEEQRAQQALASNLRHSGLVGRFKSATFDAFISKTPAQAAIATNCKEFVDKLDPRGGNALWLIGAPGTGKTHLGSAMVNHAITVKGMAACIHSVHEIMAMLRARWGARTANAWDDDAITTTDDMLAHLGRIPLLVLDEIGVTRGTDDELKQLFCIIDERYRLERPTVVLSNLIPAEMKPVLGERSYDRLREKATLLTCTWASVRGEGRDQ